MKLKTSPDFDNESVGVIERFVIARVSDTSIFGDTKEMQLSAYGFRTLKPKAGDLFYLFQGGLVGVTDPELFKESAKLNENTRFFNGYISARKRSKRGEFYVRAVVEQGRPYWIAAFPYDEVGA